mmetsp:Transcript_3493/g.2956  ORF Transcript_3493/g.2956 Transcript_3493/m.2956 type:complete len:226 (+) Transcript_3493:1-678(+)
MKRYSRAFCTINQAMSHYEILGVEAESPFEDIKKAYFSLAKKYHPDVNDANDAKYKFSLISEAYEILSDKEKRVKYDQKQNIMNPSWGSFHTQKATKSKSKSDTFKYNPDDEKWSNEEFWNDKFNFQDKTFEELNRFSKSKDGFKYHEPTMNSVKGQNITVLIDLALKEVIKGKKTIIKYDCLIQCSHCNGTKAYNLNDFVKCSNCQGNGYAINQATSQESICVK